MARAAAPRSIAPVVVLTQPARRAETFASRLGEHGIATVRWPMTAVDEAPGIDWPVLASTLTACRWVLLPSPGAIDVVMDALERHRLAWPAATGIGLIGPGSRQALDGWHDRIAGLAAATVIEPTDAPHDADALLARPELSALAGVRVAVLRRADGREAWLRTLRARGARLDAVSVYVAWSVEPPPDAGDWLHARADANAPVIFSVASGEAGARLARFVASHDRAAWLLACRVLTQHPRIADALRAAGWRSVSLHEPGPAGLVAEIESAQDAP